MFGLLNVWKHFCQNIWCLQQNRKESILLMTGFFHHKDGLGQGAVTGQCQVSAGSPSCPSQQASSAPPAPEKAQPWPTCTAIYSSAENAQAALSAAPPQSRNETLSEHTIQHNCPTGTIPTSHFCSKVTTASSSSWNHSSAPGGGWGWNCSWAVEEHRAVPYQSCPTRASVQAAQVTADGGFLKLLYVLYLLLSHVWPLSYKQLHEVKQLFYCLKHTEILG